MRPFWPALGTRRREPELMDDPGLEEGRHHVALDGLARLNRVSLTHHRVLEEVTRLWHEGRRPVQVLDVGCGDCDVLIRVAVKARRRGVEVRPFGCDVSGVALDRAHRRAAASGVKLELARLDVTRDGLPNGFDLVTSALFLHHLTETASVELLTRMACVGRRLLVQDLRRTRLGYFMALVGVHALSRSKVVRVDGLRSVRAAYTLAEVAALCRRAGLGGAVVTRCWPQRFAIRWGQS
ncbi:MAG: methyltransferase domain-containing protein [Gemmatimonadota bacterium]|nr:methyltransferase domain-containing protein [Gemmatimonadota bacterium]